jgi:hypothetical protein
MMLAPEEFDEFLRTILPGNVQTPSPATAAPAEPRITSPIEIPQVWELLRPLNDHIS